MVLDAGQQALYNSIKADEPGKPYSESILKIIAFDATNMEGREPMLCTLDTGSCRRQQGMAMERGIAVDVTFINNHGTGLSGKSFWDFACITKNTRPHIHFNAQLAAGTLDLSGIPADDHEKIKQCIITGKYDNFDASYVCVTQRDPVQENKKKISEAVKIAQWVEKGYKLPLGTRVHVTRAYDFKLP